MTRKQRVALIRRRLKTLLEEDSVAELRIPNTSERTVSGYFDDSTLLATAAASRNGKAPGVYVTLNPLRRALLARAANRIIPYAQKTTSDSDIVRRRWLPLDFDPVRPAGISSTDAEHEAALRRARKCRAWLSEQGWEEPLFCDSGNGSHLLYRIDLPNDEKITQLIKDCLQALGLRFSDDRVLVDLSTYNASRIWKIYGTLAAKGDNTKDRPHRRAKLLEVPSSIEIVKREFLEQLAATVPQPTRTTEKNKFDPGAWLAEHGLNVVAQANWNGGQKWILFHTTTWERVSSATTWKVVLPKSIPIDLICMTMILRLICQLPYYYYCWLTTRRTISLSPFHSSTGSECKCLCSKCLNRQH